MAALDAGAAGSDTGGCRTARRCDDAAVDAAVDAAGGAPAHEGARRLDGQGDRAALRRPRRRARRLRSY
ncbi:hypothetical protein C7H84_13405 [Burkholderia sp. Nafp2/4-1b]|nr:hypothetical protein C7H84_13405 [Burkholderia sp. Nafp2/4-1b]